MRFHGVFLESQHEMWSKQHNGKVRSVEEVTRVMGLPDKTELWRGKNEEAVLVYLYITEGKDLVTRQWNESNYTPFVFVNNRLHSWGWDQFHSLAQRYELVIKHR